MLKCEQKLLILSFLGRNYWSSGRVFWLVLLIIVILHSAIMKLFNIRTISALWVNKSSLTFDTWNALFGIKSGLVLAEISCLENLVCLVLSQNNSSSSSIVGMRLYEISRVFSKCTRMATMPILASEAFFRGNKNFSYKKPSEYWTTGPLIPSLTLSSKH